MTKIEFLLSLNNRLSGLPQNDVHERLNFYSEMIEDRIEEGLSEQEAVMAVGSVDKIVAQIVADIPVTRSANEKTNPKRRINAWELVLLILGCPIWLPLLIAAFAVILSLCLALWSVIISLWAIFVSVIVFALGSVVAGIGFVLERNALGAIAIIGAGVVCAGLSILLFFGCKAAAKGTLLLTKNIAMGVKKSFVKRRERNE